MKYGKTRFYADENIPANIVNYLRAKGFHVDYSVELGFHPRDDKFHLQQAKKRKCALLTNDKDFLDDGEFPFHDLKDTSIIILRSDVRTKEKHIYGFMLCALIDEIGSSGNKNLTGLKLELIGPRVRVHARIKG